LDEYVKTHSIFMRPGAEDEIVVRYVGPPGVHLADLDPEDVGVNRVPVAIVDYHPDFYAIAFGDGHVEHYERRDEHAQKIADWWTEFDERRSVNPEALPPPFE
jgi:prepilin-type processing-associated H-X9-DG protein